MTRLRLTFTTLAMTCVLAPTSEAGFLPAGLMSKSRWAHQATALGDGRVLVSDVTADVFDPATNGFTRIDGGTEPGHAAVMLADGRALLTGGGYISDGRPVFGWYGGKHVMVFDPGTDTLTPMSDLLVDRGHHTATLLRDGRVLITGGQTTNIGGFHVWTFPIRSAEIYDPATGVSREIASMAVERSDHTATLLLDGNVLIAGSPRPSTPEVFDTAAERFEPAGPMVTPRRGHTATLLRDGRVLIVGGFNEQGYIADGVEAYDPATRTFSQVGTLLRARHDAALLDDGRVLIVGGEGSDPYRRELRSAVIFDPATNGWIEAPPMATERLEPRATALGNGNVLVSGGRTIDLISGTLAGEVFVDGTSRRRRTVRR